MPSKFYTWLLSGVSLIPLFMLGWTFWLVVSGIKEYYCVESSQYLLQRIHAIHSAHLRNDLPEFVKSLFVLMVEAQAIIFAFAFPVLALIAVVHEIGHVAGGRLAYGRIVHGGIRIRIVLRKSWRTLVFPLPGLFRPHFEEAIRNERNRRLVCCVNLTDDSLVHQHRKYAITALAGPLPVFVMGLLFYLNSEILLHYFVADAKNLCLTADQYYLEDIVLYLQSAAMICFGSVLCDIFPFGLGKVSISDGVWISYLMNGQAPPGAASTPSPPTAPLALPPPAQP